MLGKLALAYLLAILAPQAVLDTKVTQPACVRSESTTPLPIYTASGAWSLNGDELLLADTQTKTILRYFSLGKFGGSITDSLYPMLQGQRLNRIIPTQSGLLIEIQGGRILRLSNDKRYPSGVQEPNVKTASGEEIAGFHQFSAIGNNIIAITDVNSGQQRWKSALIRQSFGSRTSFTTLAELDGKPRADSSLFYNLGLPYLAVIAGEKGEKSFFFEFNGEFPELYRVQNGRKELIQFPSGFSQIPDLPPASKLAKPTRDFFFRDAFRSISSRSFPVGLYSWEGKIFVLRRDPATAGGAAFTILQLNPENAGMGNNRPVKMQLRLRDADQVTLVPGPRYWAVVEKGPVTGYARQPVQGLAFISANLFRGAVNSIVDCR